MKLHQRLDQEAASLWATDPRPRDRLIAHYQSYAEKLADKRAAKQRLVDRDEYRQEALIALWQCVEAFDPQQLAFDNRACSFTTFAKYRIEFALIEAERANDWVKSKVRAAEKAGDIDLPAMLRIKESFDCLAEESDERRQGQWDTLVSLLARSKPWVASYIGTYLDAGGDVDAAASTLNVQAEYFGQVLLPKAIDELKGIPCRM